MKPDLNFFAMNLYSRGHLVTGAYYASANIKHENYTEILLPDIHGSFAKNLSAVYMEEGSKSSLGMLSPGRRNLNHITVKNV